MAWEVGMRLIQLALIIQHTPLAHSQAPDYPAAVEINQEEVISMAAQ